MALDDYKLKVGTQLDMSDVQKQLNAKQLKTTVTVTAKGTKEVTQLSDGMGKLYETTKVMNKEGEVLSNRVTKARTSFNNMSESVQKSSKHVRTLGEDFALTTAKVAKFGAITALIGAFTSSITEAVQSVKELDDSLTELKKVSDLSGDGLQEYTDQAFKMARELSTTASNVTDAVALFVQAGYDLGEAQNLAKYSIMLQSIADKTMDAETATGFLTSTMKSMNMTASEAEHVISAVNEVSNQFSITSNDLSENIGKVAGVANVAGVSYEELIGLMTSAVSKGAGASKSANAFKSIFINLQQMDSSGTIPKLSKQFENFGISMTDQNGAIKSAYDLLQELSGAYNEVFSGTNVDKQNQMRSLLEDIGG